MASIFDGFVSPATHLFESASRLGLRRIDGRIKNKKPRSSSIQRCSHCQVHPPAVAGQRRQPIHMDLVFALPVRRHRRTAALRPGSIDLFWDVRIVQVRF